MLEPDRLCWTQHVGTGQAMLDTSCPTPEPDITRATRARYIGHGVSNARTGHHACNPGRICRTRPSAWFWGVHAHPPGTGHHACNPDSICWTRPSAWFWGGACAPSRTGALRAQCLVSGSSPPGVQPDWLQPVWLHPGVRGCQDRAARVQCLVLGGCARTPPEPGIARALPGPGSLAPRGATRQVATSPVAPQGGRSPKPGIARAMPLSGKVRMHPPRTRRKAVSNICCPGCTRDVRFQGGAHAPPRTRRKAVSDISCPGCTRDARFWRWTHRVQYTLPGLHA